MKKQRIGALITAILSLFLVVAFVASCQKSMPSRQEALTSGGGSEAAGTLLNNGNGWGRDGKLPGDTATGGGGTGGSAGRTFSGEATAFRANVAGVVTVFSHAGPLGPSGGAAEASLVQTSVPGLVSAEVLHASTIGQGDRSRSEASLGEVNVACAAGQTITASFASARAEAVCTPSGVQLIGSSEVANLWINGTPVVCTGEPNQTVLLPLGLGKVIINEQVRTQQGTYGAITVNALHIIITTCLLCKPADIVVSSAHADITCEGTSVWPEGDDFVTGGGWINGTPSGAHGNFGVAGGIKKGALWGHLNYIDHGWNAQGVRHVKGTGVTSYEVVDATTRRIRGTAEVNNQGGYTYEVEVSDNGEPGRNDRFFIRLSNGYSAGGYLQGGNIQLHTK
ncbi:MAG TPA: choice-of-anchor P family protein [Verrucomicrobiae bacterium]|nr:choice-of-anchor P family protein [Verrucomicrobiae bacterium]